MEFSFLIRCHNNAQRWKYVIPTGKFHLNFKFHKNGDIRKLKAWSFRLLKNDFYRLYNERARTLQSSITIFLIHPVVRSILVVQEVHSNFTSERECRIRFSRCKKGVIVHILPSVKVLFPVY